MSFLMHYGTPRHSGRYPWGSGKNPQHSKSFSTMASELKKQGLSEVQIAKSLGMTTTELRAKKHMDKELAYGSQLATIKRLKDKGYSDNAISKRLGISPNTVKKVLDPITQKRHEETKATVNILAEEAKKKGMLDVGTGVHIGLGVSKSKLDVSLKELEAKGYFVTNIQTPQLGTNTKTTVRVLMSPDSIEQAKKEYVVKDKDKWDKKTTEDKLSTMAYVYANKHSHEISLVNAWSDNGGETFNVVKPPISIDSKRIMVRFDDDTPSGSSMDGVIQIRRGVADIALPNDLRYGQVRIAVDGTHYMKGMAIYGTNMPDGVDIIYNSNKNSSVGKLGAMKKMNDVIDQDDGGSIYIDKSGEQKINEFGASIRQYTYTDSNGNAQQSVINIVGFPGKEGSGVEGSWKTWSKTLSSQFLSKQSPELAQKQLDIAYAQQKEIFDKYMSLTNPAVKRRLLDSFADDCDSKAVHLKAAALPRQTSNVIIPITSLAPDEAYSQNYNTGEQIVLIRYPHAGTFEIPLLTVNNRNQEGIDVLGNGIDAVGIHPSAAQKLSGADFDGDTVIAIPFTGEIKTSETLKELEGFDPKKAYPKVEGMKVMTEQQEGQEMGSVSNLITDMQLQNATASEIARAVKHSMVVIDSVKHELNYRQSAEDNGIAELKTKYQGGPRAGASTIISRASSQDRVGIRKALTKEQASKYKDTLVRKNAYSVNTRTGEKVYAYTNEGYYNKAGVFVPRTKETTKMYETEDAFTLTRDPKNEIERVYAEYANSMKSLGNQARKESAATPSVKYSPSAKETYKEEVESLKAKLNIAKSNAPLERQVHLIGNRIVKLKVDANPSFSNSQIKKLKGQVLSEVRDRVGSSKERVIPTEKEWEAIQAGAISENMLQDILNNTQIEVIQELATPRASIGLNASELSMARLYIEQGREMAEIASMLGISVSTLDKALKGV